MGCWNKTSALTNLPIYENDETVLFFIVNSSYNKDQSMACHANNFWELIPLPFYGKYDDYGRQKMDSGEEWKLQELKKALGKYVVKREAENIVDRTVIDETVFDSFETLFTAIHRNRLKLKVNDVTDIGSGDLFSFIMMERNIFNELTQIDLIQAKSFLDKWDASSNDTKYVCPDDILLIGPIHTRFKLSYFNGMDFSEDSFDIEFKIKEIIKGYALVGVFTKLRKIFVPMSGEGSQQRLNDHIEIYMNALNKRYQQLKDMDSEYYDEGDE